MCYTLIYGISVGFILRATLSAHGLDRVGPTEAPVEVPSVHLITTELTNRNIFLG